MKSHLAAFLNLLIIIVPAQSLNFTIGALVSDVNVLSNFKRIVTSISDMLYDEVITFRAEGEVLSLNALRATNQVCNLFKSSHGRLFALIVSHPNGASGSPPLSVSYTCSFYHVPVIGISARQAVFSDKYSHSSFLRTVSPYSSEALIWADLIKAFQWREICVIHSDDQDAKMLLLYLESASNNGKNFKITREVVINTDEEDAAKIRDFVSILKPIKNEQTRVVLLFLKRVFAEYVFLAARKLEMLGVGWAWIVSEQALDASNIPNGVIGVRLLQSSEMDHIADAVRVVTQGILNMVNAHPAVMRHLRSVQSCSDNPSEIRSKSRGSDRTSFTWKEYATKLFSHMLKVNTTGRTGHLEFDDYGDRVRPIYEIVNAQLLNSFANSAKPHKPTFDFERPTLVPIGTYGIKQSTPNEWMSDEPYPELLSVNMSKLIWPGNNIVKRPQIVCMKRVNTDNGQKCEKTEMQLIHSAPISFKKKTHLKVVTVQGIPFIHTRPLLIDANQNNNNNNNNKCNESDDPTISGAEVECTHTDPITNKETTYCCYGYCVDLLRRLANRSSFTLSSTLFTYKLHLVGDGQIGDEVVENEKRKWTGVVGELLSGQADLAIAPISITPERAARIEFSKPYKYLGITILVKRERARSNLGSFLQPFENSLWVLVALSVHVVAFVLYLLDKFSPFGRTSSPSYQASHGIQEVHLSEENTSNNNNNNNTKLNKAPNTSNTSMKQYHLISHALDDGLNLSSAVYFAWGVLLNSGIGEATPRSFSARVLGMVWAGFAMIIVASYTANLAAFLVLDRPESAISGIDDARLRNPQNDFSFATIRGSPVEMYFKRQVEYSTLYRTMEAHNYDSIDEAIKAVKSGKLKAFIWDSVRLNYEASRDCELITVGEVFGRTSYGLAMKKHNPWLYELSQAVLNFHERGIMELLDTKWIHTKLNDCERTEASPATLGLTNMGGVFIMIGVGIVVGTVIIFIEILCIKQSKAGQNNKTMSALGLHQWRETVQKNKALNPSRTTVNNDNDDNDDAGDDSTLLNITHSTTQTTTVQNRTDQNRMSKHSNLKTVTSPSHKCDESSSRIHPQFTAYSCRMEQDTVQSI